MNEVWKIWQCLGGDLAGTPCTPGGDECGARGQCTTEPLTTIACINYRNAPPDLRQIAGFFGRATVRQNLATAQESSFREAFPRDVFAMVPVKGFVVWDSHAFNLTKADTTVEQWMNLSFAPSGERLYPRTQIFDADDILRFDSPNKEDRTFVYCSVWDNGESNPSEVRRESIKPDAETCAFVDQFAPLANQAGLGLFTCGCVPADRSCFGGPNQGMPCKGDDSVCGTDGVCDARPVGGGVTTEEEMFILLGSYYIETP